MRAHGVKVWQYSALTLYFYGFFKVMDPIFFAQLLELLVDCKKLDDIVERSE